MSDLEGLVKRLIAKGWAREQILAQLLQEIMFFKDISRDEAAAFAEAVISEVETSMKAMNDERVSWILKHQKAGATMHDLGVGCRGEGDFFVHRLLSEIAEIGTPLLLGPRAQDDAGAVEYNGGVIVVAVDGTHSRLTEFPFIAGFHVARAALRDVYVKGARPVAMFVDLHLADDGDVSVLFDFMGGVRAVSELSRVPIVAGSTLRVGGDMVIGTRFVSCVGAVGVAKSKEFMAARSKIKPGDDIVMTEGAGGGTIATTAIYGGMPEVVLETLNVQFIEACEALLKEGLFDKIHAATDWTNGGLRGDCNEICKIAGVGMVIYEDKVKALLNKKVLDMLEKFSIDYLGVSMDALLVFTPPENTDEVLRTLRRAGVKSDVIGRVIDEPKMPILVRNGEKVPFNVLYREAAYTKVKKIVGEQAPAEKEKLMEVAEKAAQRSIEKANNVVRFVLERRNTRQIT
ncbi:MAG: AIR synthase-related protein [Candidatus Jordarchaeales archaeon]